jgi:hypothetical protein
LAPPREVGERLPFRRSSDDQCPGADKPPAPAAADPQRGYTVGRRGRNGQVIDPADQLVRLTVYKRGAEEVVRRLAA